MTPLAKMAATVIAANTTVIETPAEGCGRRAQ